MIHIRPETPSDYQHIFEINAQAFQQEAESLLIEKLRKSEYFIPELSIVAEKGGELIGHILFSKIRIEGEVRTPSIALAPMAVLPEFQNQGIGSLLIREGLEKVKEMGFKSVIVLGHKDYYPRFGFKKASNWGIQSPFEVPDEVFMAIELEEGALANAAGVVVYPEAFSSF